MKKLVMCAVLMLVASVAKADDPLDFLRTSMEMERWMLQQAYNNALIGRTTSPYSMDYLTQVTGTATSWGTATANSPAEMSTFETSATANRAQTVSDFLIIQQFMGYEFDLGAIDNDPYYDAAMMHLWYDTLYPLD